MYVPPLFLRNREHLIELHIVTYTYPWQICGKGIVFSALWYGSPLPFLQFYAALILKPDHNSNFQ